MRKGLLLLLIAIGFFMACKKDNQTPIVNNDVRGNWTSVKAVGGSFNGVGSGAATDRSRFLEIRDSTLRMWVNDSLIMDVTYKLTAHKYETDTTAHFYLEYSNGTEQSIQFAHDSLLVGIEAIAYDGAAYYYVRTSKAAPSH